MLIPGHAFMDGEKWRESCLLAATELQSADANDARVPARAKELFDAWRWGNDHSDKITHFMEATGNAAKMWTGARPMHDSLHSLLQTVIIQTWIAFEVLAEDLLKRVLKRRPSLDTRLSWHGDERQQSGYRSRGKIANYYRWTFRTDNADILAVVDTSAIHALAILRNSLVHCGGLVDKDFQDDRKGFFKGVVKSKATAQRFPIPELKRIKGRAIGYRIPFTGSMVRSFVDPVVPLGFALVKAVDGWLHDHK